MTTWFVSFQLTHKGWISFIPSAFDQTHGLYKRTRRPRWLPC
jgi:hypothetical protein